jgi:hypothetical protein
MINSLKDLILNKIDPLARQYHRNVISFYTGFDALGANLLDLEEGKHFLKCIWARCLEWSNQRPSRIQKSLKKLDNFLNSFEKDSEVHDITAFLHKLRAFGQENNLTTERGYDPQNTMEEIIELFTMFYSVRIKTASLIMRFLYLDSNFFGECCPASNPPLDRVNFRMLQRLNIQNGLTEKTSYGPKEQKTFSQIGADILGKDKKGLIDNLWFIGHFYCDDNEDCSYRDVFDFLEPKIVKRIDFWKSCPLISLNCSKQKKDSGEEYYGTKTR